MAALPWANAALFAAQLYVNDALSHRIGPVSRQHETLITPAPYAFSIWGVIYTLLSIFVVVDCSCSSFLIFAAAERATLLRLAFAVSCAANIAWVALFSNGYVNVATGVLAVLWFALLALYVHILADRRARVFSRARYLLGELPIIIYFTWTCAAMLISVAVTLQDVSHGFLSLPAYLVLLAVLVVMALSAVIFEGELAFGLVAVWALIAIAVKEQHLEPDVERVSHTVRACAELGAVTIAVFVVLCLVLRAVRCSGGCERLKRAMPFLSEKHPYPDYGSSA